MSITFEPDLWWDAVSQTLKFYAHFDGRRIHCAVSRPALEHYVKSSGMTSPELERIFREHRDDIELRASKKIRTGRFESAGKIFVKAADLK